MPLVSSLIPSGPAVRIVQDGPIDPDGRCVLLWMQRSQRATDNPALNVAIVIGNH